MGRQKSLANGRPPAAKSKEATRSMSSKATRNIIRTHHRLHKELAATSKTGDESKAEELRKKIEENGGLSKYQAASIQGQSKLRGGDSSTLLVSWLRQANIIGSHQKLAPSSEHRPPYKLLEVGALSTKNNISMFPETIAVTRIDLNSQAPGIERQDFMMRPLPKLPDEAFDIISLSLVLNYVPDAIARGEMLKRITQFLRPQLDRHQKAEAALPALFLVLPLPCVDNSRYLDEHLLFIIMRALGFSLSHHQNTPKLANYLFRYDGKKQNVHCGNNKVRDGKGMNNFKIILES